MTRDAEATRERLLREGKKAFSQRGFERTTVREVAGAAGVNPALINRYFGGKEQLFAEAVSIDLAFPNLQSADQGRIGEILVNHFFQRWEGDESDDLLRVLVRSATTNEKAAARIREILTSQVSTMVAKVAGPERAHERASLIATQILGLAYTRYVLGLSDKDVSQAVVRRMVGKTVQRYLFDPLEPDVPAT